MPLLTFFSALLLLLVGLAWWRMPLSPWLGLVVVAFTAGGVSGLTPPWLSAAAAVLPLVLLALLHLPGLRRLCFSGPLLVRVKGAMPPLSATEREAIEAGTVGWEGELFSGRPRWGRLFAVAAPSLSAAERAFLDGPVEEVCAMVDDWEVTAERNDLPAPVWEFLKAHGFFGMNAATEYGGRGFSAHAQSCIVQKLGTRSATLAVTVMVPNSLGPAELLHHYGTDEQKRHYLPRLARGEEIPCFGLTNPWAGSDASSMPDCGMVCEGEVDGHRTLGFRVTWDKRYITLSPVSTLLGLAFRAWDPQRLLGGATDLGITCALVPTDTAGVFNGARHLPLNAAFQNGPNRGRDVFIPLHWVIGGREQVGRGWGMLMECLAAGRGVSLPAVSAAAAKLAVRTSGAYARVREQFGVPIGRFEAVEEALARMGGRTWLLEGARTLMTGALAGGEKPAVMSAIVKQQCTELARGVVNDAMDIHAGKGICMGRSNYLARTYQQLPIGITVEGANLLTRGLIIFGQGAMRCHPYLLEEIRAVSAADAGDALTRFDRTLARHLTHLLTNTLRSLIYGMSRGRLARGHGSGVVRRHSRTIEHLSAAFALLADVTLLLLGGALKRREMLSGRFADALSQLFLASAALKKFHDQGQLAEEAPLVDFACRHALCHAEYALDGILRNYPRRWLGVLLRPLVFGAGRYGRMPDDALAKRTAAVVQSRGAARDRLTEHMYLPTAPHEIIARLEDAFARMEESRELRRRLRKEQRHAAPGQDYAAWVGELRAQAVVTAEEAALLIETRALVSRVIAVDEFPVGDAAAANFAPKPAEGVDVGSDAVADAMQEGAA